MNNFDTSVFLNWFQMFDYLSGKKRCFDSFDFAKLSLPTKYFSVSFVKQVICTHFLPILSV